MVELDGHDALMVDGAGYPGLFRQHLSSIATVFEELGQRVLDAGDRGVLQVKPACFCLEEGDVVGFRRTRAPCPLHHFIIF